MKSKNSLLLFLALVSLLLYVYYENFKIKRENSKLNETIAETDLKLSQVEEKLENAEKTEADLKDELKEQQKLIQAKDVAMKEYRDTQVKEKEELSEALKSAKDMKENLEKKEKEIQEKDSKISKLSADFEKAKGDNVGLEKTQNELKKSISEKDLKIFELEKSLKENENKLLDALKPAGNGGAQQVQALNESNQKNFTIANQLSVVTDNKNNTQVLQ